MNAKTTPKRRTGRKALTAPAATQPQGLPALFERAAKAPNFDADALTKLYALKAQIDALADRRAFEQDFAALQAEVGRVSANAYDPQKKRAYADINAIDDAVRALTPAKGFALSFDSAPSTVAGSITVTATLSREGCACSASAIVQMDGVGLKGAINMSPAQASGATFTYGRRMAMTALFNLTVGSKPTEPPRERPAQSDHQIARLRRAAASAASPPSEDEILRLDLFLRERGEQADAVLDERGALERSAVKQFVLARKGRRQ